MTLAQTLIISAASSKYTGLENLDVGSKFKKFEKGGDNDGEDNFDADLDYYLNKEMDKPLPDVSRGKERDDYLSRAMWINFGTV